jgi:hypothetical protein
MNISRYAISGLIVAVGLGLAGCGDLAKTIGSLENPDGTQTPKAPPLSLPPDYNLRPPVPGGRGDPNRVNVDQARQTLFKKEAPKPGEAVPESRSAGEAALLSKAVAPGRPAANIRSEIDEETESLKESESGFVDKVLNWDEEGAEGVLQEDEGFLKSVIVTEEKPIIKRK